MYPVCMGGVEVYVSKSVNVILHCFSLIIAWRCGAARRREGIFLDDVRFFGRRRRRRPFAYFSVAHQYI